jgi:hypothetical protein
MPHRLEEGIERGGNYQILKYSMSTHEPMCTKKNEVFFSVVCGGFFLLTDKELLR